MLNVCRFIQNRFIFLSLVAVYTGVISLAYAEDSRNKAGEVVSVLGTVFIREDGSKPTHGLRTAKPGDPVYAGDVINTSSKGGLKILLKDKSIVDLGPSALFKVSQFVPGANGERQVELNVAYGSVRAAVTEKLTGKSKFKLRTPSAVMGVRGTITFTEVKQSDSLKGMSSFLNSNGAAPSAAAPGAPKVPSTTFLITQGQGVVTNNGGGNAAGKEVVLNPGDQATANPSAGGGGMSKQSLSQEQFNTKAQQVQNMSRTTDTAFVMATNFERAVEQKQQEKSADRQVSKANESSEKDSSSKDGSKDKQDNKDKQEAKESKSEKSDSKGSSGDSKDSSKDTASKDKGSSESGSGRAPASAPAVGGSILDSITTDVAAVAPVAPQITVSNMGISGAPSTDQILSQQTGTNSAPAAATRHLTVNVRWQK